MDNDEEIKHQAIDFAKKHKDEIAKELTDVKTFEADEIPISVFMAGSPGAGKTEFSKALIGLLEARHNHSVLRIDADDYRTRIPGYTGGNSDLVHGAVSIIAEKIHDCALANRQTFVFDGTLWNYDKAEQNIRRSLAKGRVVFVFLIYQHPRIAWEFTLRREQKEGRMIPKDAYIRQFLGAQETARRLKDTFGNDVSLMVVKKDFTKHDVESITEIDQAHPIDSVIHERYTKDELE